MGKLVAILTLIPVAAFAADGAMPEAAKVRRLTVAGVTERIPLPREAGSWRIEVDALAKTIKLHAKRGRVAPLLARLKSHTGMLCPEAREVDGSIELVCRTRRIEAALVTDKKEQYLDINELRGLPWAADGKDAPPYFHWDPWRVGLATRCPGKNEGAQGECWLKEGDRLQAAYHFRKALDTNNRQLAAVRLGDLALIMGDPVTALGWYHRGAPYGVFGRVAASRVCEMDGGCLQSTDDVLRVFDSLGLPEPLRAEMAVRAARAEAYAGRGRSAVNILLKQVRAHGMDSVCREGGDFVCRRVLLAAMRDQVDELDKMERAAALAARAGKGGDSVVRAGGVTVTPETKTFVEDLFELYFALPSWDQGPLAVELGEAAAPLAIAIGAPIFAGNLLAALAPQVPPGDLSDHLVRAAETFLVGHDWVRARVISEYATTRLDKKQLASPRWAAVSKALAVRLEEEEISDELRAQIEDELTKTREDLNSAEATRARIHELLGGVQASKKGGAGAGSGKAEAGADGKAGAGADGKDGATAAGGEGAGGHAGAATKAGESNAGAATTGPTASREGDAP